MTGRSGGLFFAASAALLFFTALYGAEHECSGCGTSKLMVQCDYYVVRRGDLSKSGFCENYAKALDAPGTHAKAAWYYLLGQKPQMAQRSAIAAIEEGQIYAAEYAAEASVIFHEYKAAKKYMKMLPKDFLKSAGFKKDLEILGNIYPDVDFSRIE